ncbi:hypothetical protein GCM10007315_19780 [Gemmobacter tilapiae]|uniref:L,D-TPase catalytic domain-containing protein n=1 Tax=Neogemmobacter tilapiae TaxID=875041 RepID=A0A918TP85_9RHOB|nr:hypothetical protein GCM10007315_19780 [Gemmobacter tilapiae]
MIVTPQVAHFRGRFLPCSIGRSGLIAAGEKREGDGATPLGRHRILGLLYRPDRLSRPTPWATPIGPTDLWSDDPADPAYNSPVRHPHGFSHEKLRRCDPMYDLILLTDWNYPHAAPGKGSAIFVHTWRAPRRATAGCVAFSRSDLRWLAGHLMPGATLIIQR